MKYFIKINVLLLSFILIGGFVYLQKNPGFKFSKIDTSNLEIGINQAHAFIKKPNGSIKYIPLLKDEKDLEIIWSTNHQDIYLLRRKNNQITQLFLVHPITGIATQKSFNSRPKAHLQAISKQRVSFQSGNEVLLFSFRTNKMEGILPPLFINQTPESRAKIFAFYHQLEGQLIDYRVDPNLKDICFKWKDLSNQVSIYNQKLIVSKNTLPLPDK